MKHFNSTLINRRYFKLLIKRAMARTPSQKIRIPHLHDLAVTNLDGSFTNVFQNRKDAKFMDMGVVDIFQLESFCTNHCLCFWGFPKPDLTEVRINDVKLLMKESQLTPLTENKSSVIGSAAMVMRMLEIRGTHLILRLGFFLKLILEQRSESKNQFTAVGHAKEQVILSQFRSFLH